MTRLSHESKRCNSSQSLVVRKRNSSHHNIVTEGDTIRVELLKSWLKSSQVIDFTDAITAHGSWAQYMKTIVSEKVNNSKWVQLKTKCRTMSIIWLTLTVSGASFEISNENVYSFSITHRSFLVLTFFRSDYLDAMQTSTTLTAIFPVYTPVFGEINHRKMLWKRQMNL